MTLDDLLADRERQLALRRRQLANRLGRTADDLNATAYHLRDGRIPGSLPVDLAALAGELGRLDAEANEIRTLRAIRQAPDPDTIILD